MRRGLDRPAHARTLLSLGEHPAAASLWRTPGLGVLFTASTTARLASETARVAVVLLVLERTGSAALAGALVAALALPALVTGPLMGAWLDTTPHRRSAFVANQVLLPAVLLALLALAGHGPAWAVVALGGLAGITSPVLTGGFTGLLAPLVPPHLLRQAYGAESTSYNIAGVAGPALASAIAAGATTAAAVLTAAALSVMALLTVLRVPMPKPLGLPTVGLLRSVAGGITHLARTPALRSVTVATTLSFMGMGAFPVVFPLFTRDLGSSTEASGVLFSAFAIGALAGSVTMAARAPRMGPLRLPLTGISGLMVALAVLACSPSLILAVVIVLVAGALEGPVFSSTLTVREQHTPATMRTQVVTTAASLKFGAFALGSLMAGHVAGIYDGRSGVWFIAGCELLGVTFGAMALGWPALRHRFARAVPIRQQLPHRYGPPTQNDSPDTERGTQA